MSQKERTVSYFIDDLQALRVELIRDGGLTEDQADSLTENLPSFRAVYTLYGYGKTVDRYELKEFTEKDAKKIDINTLNSYEHSILGECQFHFCGIPLPDGEIFPTGVVCIQGDGTTELPPLPSCQAREEPPQKAEPQHEEGDPS